MIVTIIIQKAGFLFVEQAFSVREAQFRRRVVLTVCYSKYWAIQLFNSTPPGDDKPKTFLSLTPRTFGTLHVDHLD